MVALYRGMQWEMEPDDYARYWTTDRAQAERYARPTTHEDPIWVYAAEVSLAFLKSRAAAPDWDGIEPIHLRALNAELTNIRQIIPPAPIAPPTY